MRNRYWLDGIMGLVVGDALGVPVQFMHPEDIKNRRQGPVTGMEGNGTYNMPVGTWSDDSSMALATLDSINIKNRLDAGDVMVNFVKWLYKGEYTPFGEAFDEGNTCSAAIIDFTKNAATKTCGRTGEHSNGNGALMRIMPVCLYAFDKQKADPSYDDAKAVADVHEIASLTHNHLRSNMACGLYFFCVREIIENRKCLTLQECLQKGIDKGLAFYGKNILNLTEMAHYGRLFNLDELKSIPDTEMSFSGYVVSSLEAAIWSLIQTDNFKDCLLKIVNYGDDSDTVAAIAGGLAGLYYGYESIPAEWLSVIQRREWLERMVLLDDTADHPVADIHIHAIPGVDDGSKSLEMSMEMIRSSYQQGARIIFLTSHSWGLAEDDNISRYYEGVNKIRELCKSEMPELKLYEGCEVLVYSEDLDDVIGALDERLLPTLAGTKYVLTEFHYHDMDLNEAVACVKRILDAGYIPVLAHVERYAGMLESIESVRLLKQMGALVQINLYSIAEETGDIIRKWANDLLNERLVDFVGTDAHRMTHRPPKIAKGVETLYEKYPADYADAILYGNARNMILGE